MVKSQNIYEYKKIKPIDDTEWISPSCDYPNVNSNLKMVKNKNTKTLRIYNYLKKMGYWLIRKKKPFSPLDIKGLELWYEP